MGAFLLVFIPCNALYVILSENMGTPRDTVYPWGKGVCKHKTGDCRLRRLTGQQRSIRRVRIPRKGTILQNPRKILLYLRGEKGAHKQKSEHYCLQQYKTKRFYIKSVLFRFFSQRICVKVIYKYRTAIKPSTHIVKTIPRKKTVYCYIARVSY